MFRLYVRVPVILASTDLNSSTPDVDVKFASDRKP